MPHRTVSKGIGSGDLHQWQRPSPCERVEDERKGKILCKRCGEEVAQVEADGVWTNRDLETNLPHRLTCSAE